MTGITLLLCILLVLAGVLLIGAEVKKAPRKPVLSIICFKGYAEPTWVKPFEKKYNATVKVTYVETADECFTKVKTNPKAYHIVSVNAGRVKIYYDEGLIQAIDTEKLENYGNMVWFFRGHSYAEMEWGVKYHVPMTWGTQTITVNTAKIPEKQLRKYLSKDKKTISLNVLTAKEFKGKTALFDETTNVVSIAAIHSGIKTPFTFEPKDWKKVEAKLLAWKRNARTFTTGLDSEFDVVSAEEALILLGGNDTLLNLKLEEAGIRGNFTQYPMTQGTICLVDGWVITKPTAGKSLNLALKYIDYIIGDEGQSNMAKLVGFGIVNTAGKEAYDPVALEATWWYGEDPDDVPFPIYIMVAEEDPGRRLELWNKVKATP